MAYLLSISCSEMCFYGFQRFTIEPLDIGQKGHHRINYWYWSLERLPLPCASAAYYSLIPRPHPCLATLSTWRAWHKWVRVAAAAAAVEVHYLTSVNVTGPKSDIYYTVHNQLVHTFQGLSITLMCIMQRRLKSIKTLLKGKSGSYYKPLRERLRVLT